MKKKEMRKLTEYVISKLTPNLNESERAKALQKGITAIYYSKDKADALKGKNNE